VTSLALCRGAVVEDEVELHPRITALGVAPLEQPQELQELLRPVALGVLGGHLAALDLERGVQVGGPVALVVVSPSLHLPGTEGQHRLGAGEGLDHGLLVDREHDRALGRVEVQAHDVDDLLHQAGVAGET